MYNYKELNGWNRSVDFTCEIYRISEEFPDFEKYGIISQLRRASSSIPANIAEGSGKSSKKDFNRFLEIANGSCNEVDTFLVIALKLNYFKEEKYNDLYNELIIIRKMIFGLMKANKKAIE